MHPWFLSRDPSQLGFACDGPSISLCSCAAARGSNLIRLLLPFFSPTLFSTLTNAFTEPIAWMKVVSPSVPFISPFEAMSTPLFEDPTLTKACRPVHLKAGVVAFTRLLDIYVSHASHRAHRAVQNRFHRATNRFQPQHDQERQWGRAVCNALLVHGQLARSSSSPDSAITPHIPSALAATHTTFTITNTYISPLQDDGNYQGGPLKT